MAKKKIQDGAPLYMAQFTALMTILLAFFIIYQAMAESQSAGFDSGIGSVQNAFGIKGGLGIFNFVYFGKGGGKVPNPTSSGKDEEQGVHENLVKSEGGEGNTDLDVDEADVGRYLRIQIPLEFPDKSSILTDKMRIYLRDRGTGFALFDYKLNIRCYAGDFGDEITDVNLAMKRSAQIMRYLNFVGVPYERMQATGYANRRYFVPKPEKKQAQYFYIFMKGYNRKKRKQTR